jgi:hypothetical protein
MLFPKIKFIIFEGIDKMIKKIEIDYKKYIQISVEIS